MFGRPEDLHGGGYPVVQPRVHLHSHSVEWDLRHGRVSESCQSLPRAVCRLHRQRELHGKQLQLLQHRTTHNNDSHIWFGCVAVGVLGMDFPRCLRVSSVRVHPPSLPEQLRPAEWPVRDVLGERSNDFHGGCYHCQSQGDHRCVCVIARRALTMPIVYR